MDSNSETDSTLYLYIRGSICTQLTTAEITISQILQFSER